MLAVKHARPSAWLRDAWQVYRRGSRISGRM